MTGRHAYMRQIENRHAQQNVFKVQSRSREQEEESEGTDSHEDTVIKRPA